MAKKSPVKRMRKSVRKSPMKKLSRKSPKKVAKKSPKLVRKSPMKAKKSVKKSPKKMVRKSPMKTKKSAKKSPMKTKKSVKKSPKKVAKKSPVKRMRYAMNAGTLTGGLLPADVYVKMFGETTDVKEKIKLLSLSRSIRDAIYDTYGGKEAVDAVIRGGKKDVIVKNIITLIEEADETVDFEYIRDMMKEHNIAPSELRDPKSGITILMIAAKYAHLKDAKKLLEYLLKKGDVDINEQDAEGMTALMHACVGYSAKRKVHVSDDAVEMLLEAGADISIEDNEGNTAVEYVNDYDILDMLEEYGADEDRIEDARNELGDEYDPSDY